MSTLFEGLQWNFTSPLDNSVLVLIFSRPCFFFFRIVDLTGQIIIIIFQTSHQFRLEGEEKKPFHFGFREYTYRKWKIFSHQCHLVFELRLIYCFFFFFVFSAVDGGYWIVYPMAALFIDRFGCTSNWIFTLKVWANVNVWEREFGFNCGLLYIYVVFGASRQTIRRHRENCDFFFIRIFIHYIQFHCMDMAMESKRQN